jgi:hypothetical protein
MIELKIAPCTFEAAKYAVLNWHYSKAMPAGKLAKFGIWENGNFVGAIIFGRGATPQLVKPYGLKQTEACELVRIAMRKHEAPVSQALAECIKQLKKTNPSLRLIISFADPAQGHIGGIYKATNWIYTGRSADANFFKTEVGDKIIHPRTIQARKNSIGKNGDIILPYTKINKPGKYRYLFPLDKNMRKQILKLSKPYPRGASIEGDTLSDQLREVGSTPTLRSSKKVSNG